MSRGGDFWSRRKAAVEAEQRAETERSEAERAAEAREALEARSDEEILAELGLPDPDALEPGQEISGFMARHVPERLRRRALRQLWRLNPVLANLDGLNDYDGDFTNAATDAPGVATAYRVGKGLLKHVEALEAEAERARQSASGGGDGDAAGRARGGASGQAPENPRNLSDIAGKDPGPLSAGIGPEKMRETPAFSENMQDDAVSASASTTMVASTDEYADAAPWDTNEATAPRPRRMRFRMERDR